VLTNEIALPTLMFWIPVGLYVCSVRNMEVLYHIMVKTSFVILGLLLFCFLYRDNVEMYGEEAQSYNMFFGYSMAFVSLFHINEYYRVRKLYLLLLFIAEVLLIFLYANRGALLSIVFFIFVKLVLDQQKVGAKFFWTICLGIASIVIINESSLIAESAINFFSSYNIESRTLQKIASDAFTESNTRDELRGIALEMVSERPLIGWGVGGECNTIGLKMGMPTGASHAYSPHNGIIQLWLYFGVLIGSVVNLILILPIFRMNKIKNKYQHSLVLICCSAYFVTTLWSSCDILLKPAVAIYFYLTYFYKQSDVI
jgi:O-antigen ligase